MEKNQKKAYVFAGLSVFLWSTVATAFKLTLRHSGYAQLLLMSAVFSLASLALIVTLEKKWKLMFRLSRGDVIRSLLLGTLNPFLYYLMIFKAYSLLPAQIAQPLNQIWGVVIVLLSIPLLKQKIGIISIAGVITSFFGVVILSTKGNFSVGDIREPFGVSLALLSSVVWSLYWIWNTRSGKDPLILLTMNFLSGSVLALAFFLFAQPGGGFRLPAVTGSLYIGCFEMGVTYLFWLKALKYSITTVRVSILIYLAPFVSLIFIHYILGEIILLSSFAGLFLIVSGILISRLDKRTLQTSPPPRET